MIGDDGLNRGDFLLGSHAGSFNFLFSVRNQEWSEIFGCGPFQRLAILPAWRPRF